MLKRFLCCLPIVVSLAAAHGQLPAESEAPLPAPPSERSRLESLSIQEQSPTPSATHTAILPRITIVASFDPDPREPHVTSCDCCAKKPFLSDHQWFYFGGQIAIVTQRHTSDGGPLQDQVLVIWNLTNEQYAPTNAWWNPNSLPYAEQYYSDPSWNSTNLGDVFGLALDNLGNIYVAASNIYGSAAVGDLGSTFSAPQRAGQIYKIANGTGSPSLFGNPLPNDSNGLGNIAWDCGHNSLFASDFHDGLIYRLNAGGTQQPNPWDHGVNLASAVDIHGGALNRPPINPGNVLSSYTDLGRRPWAVRVYQGRLYYSIWSRDRVRQVGAGPNEIWSVALNAAGDPVPPARLEISLPQIANRAFSNPVSDISFTAMGTMLVAERGMFGDNASYAHEARALEFSPSGVGWVPSPALYVVGSWNPYGTGPANSAGGVDFDITPGSRFPVWVSGDALHLGNPDEIYGIQGFPAAGGGPTDSLLIDADDVVSLQNKTYVGDVRIPCPERVVIAN